MKTPFTGSDGKTRLKAYYSDVFRFPLPKGHRFPEGKYALLRQRLQAEFSQGVLELGLPPAATREQILRAHTPEYGAKVFNGTLSPGEQRRIGLPWSPALLTRTLQSVGGTIAAALTAFSEGSAVNLGGGTHHAFADHGEGYCIFNDVAVAARELQARRGRVNILIIDCDVHQGNGTADFFKADESVFTFSIHGRENFPFRKQPSDLDVPLESGCGDREYHAALEDALRVIEQRFEADFVFYLAGADAYAGDRLGKLALTKEGIFKRDQMVFDWCKAQRLPVALVMGGGYAQNLNDIVDIHYQTVVAALEFSKRMEYG